MQLSAPPFPAPCRAPAARAPVWLLAFTLGFITLLSCAELAAVVHRTGGAVLFSLDDPYIHLALAEHIARFLHYGINDGEFAAPSSSIAYPFLLAPLVAAGLGQWGAWLLCFAATLASGLLLCAILIQAGWARHGAAPVLALIPVLFVVDFNLIGLEFTGMEHSLHVALTLGCLLGALHFLEDGKAGWWWLACAIAAPLVRYEGATCWLGTVALLLWHGRYLPAALVASAGALGLGGFALWLHLHGLPPLPSSVLVKLGDEWNAAAAPPPAAALSFAYAESAWLILAAPLLLLTRALRLAIACAAAGLGLAAATGLIAAAAGVWHLPGKLTSLILSSGLPIMLAGFVLLAIAARDSWRRHQHDLSAVALFGLFILGGHIVAGRFGWFSRYEAYAMIAGAVCLLVVYAEPASLWLRQASVPQLAIFTLGSLLATLPYPLRALQTPAAAQHIFEQQFQMHRFVTDFAAVPVAVNDIGEVSFGNPHRVLDLWGLASEPARIARQDDDDPLWMEHQAQAAHVPLAILYPDWFPGLPPTWQLLATMSSAAANPVNAETSVSFYATSAPQAAKLRAALQRFKPTLPAGVTLDIR